MPQNLFKISDGRNYFWQWDTNQKLYVLDPTVDEVHFSNRDMTHAIPKDVCTDKDGKRVCYIPDVLLTLPKNLVASAYVTDDNATKTLRSIKFAVRQRAIPADYVTNDDLQFEDFTERLDIIEDIIDSGFTMMEVRKILESRGTKKLKLCSCLSKPSRREVDVEIEFLGFEIPDKFVVGYGLDYDEKYRSLPYIGYIEA